MQAICHQLQFIFIKELTLPSNVSVITKDLPLLPLAGSKTKMMLRPLIAIILGNKMSHVLLLCYHVNQSNRTAHTKAQSFQTKTVPTAQF